MHPAQLSLEHEARGLVTRLLIKTKRRLGHRGYPRILTLRSCSLGFSLHAPFSTEKIAVSIELKFAPVLLLLQPVFQLSSRIECVLPRVHKKNKNNDKNRAVFSDQAT